jgi:V8-like Glu-specific endopeptidase
VIVYVPVVKSAMRTLLLTALTLGACTEGPPSTGVRDAPIIGGTFDNSDPAVVALTSAGQQAFCTGTLISSKIVLTAAHCVYQGPGQPASVPGFIFFGARVGATSGTFLRTRSATYHELFNPDTLEHDIAIVVLEDRATVQPVPWNVTPPQIDQLSRHVGFGLQGVDGDGDFGEKMQVSVPITNVEEGQFRYDQATCNGDSGGPAFITVDGVEVVAGITSWGDQGCHYYGWSQRVDIHDAWLTALVAANDPLSCERDWRCASGCAAVDLDCPCASDDGFCDAHCEDTDSDSDCPQGCGENGTCLGAECPNPDPDCGDPCGAEGHCVEECATRDADCDAPLALGELCERDFDCDPAALCLLDAEQDKRCVLSCSDTACPSGYECKQLTQSISVCEALPPAPGSCAVAPGAASGGRGLLAGLLAALTLLGVARRRR